MQRLLATRRSWHVLARLRRVILVASLLATVGFTLVAASAQAAVGPYYVLDIDPGVSSSNPFDLVDVNGIVYFAADDGTHGTELWKSDGTMLGTTMVKDINPSGNSSPRFLTAVGSTLYFRATDGLNGFELWKSNGTAAGTVDGQGHQSERGFEPWVPQGGWQHLVFPGERWCERI